MKAISPEEIESAVRSFGLPGELRSVVPLERGHIHDTFISNWRTGAGPRRVLHQRMNAGVFKDISGLMHNIARVTEHLRRDTWRSSRSDLEVLDLIQPEGQAAWLDLPSGPWRCYGFVEDTVSYDRCLGPDQAFDAASAFGDFQARLFDLDARHLVETIPDFFSSPHRLRQFHGALRDDALGRAALVQPEIRFVLERWHKLHVMEAGMKQGRIPCRVIHGDTKLNNVLFDQKTGRARCIVDLDTCMPGWPLYDFGDLVRFAAATSAEDEPDPRQAGIDLEIYAGLLAGWMSTAGHFMNSDERELMPLAAQLVTLTIGMRFLTDHLRGDVYFKIHHEGHNLERARVQFAMVKAMELHAAAMHP